MSVVLTPTSSIINNSTIVSPVSNFMSSTPFLLSPVLTPKSITPTLSVNKKPHRISFAPLNSDSIWIPSINLTYTEPVLAYYQNLNADPRIHARVVNHFYYKTLEKWLYNSLKNILGYLVIKDGKVNVISKSSDYKKEVKDSKSDMDKKINYIEKYVFSKKDLKTIFSKFVMETGIPWYDIYKHTYYVKKVIKNALKRKFRNAIKD